MRPMRAIAADNRRQLAAAGDQIRAMLDEARKEAAATADSIVRKAQQEAEAGRQRAEREIGGARDQALMEIWSKTADLAVSVAGRVLSKELGEADHRRLVEVALNELPADAGNGRKGPSLMSTAPQPTTSVMDEAPPEQTRNYADALLGAGGAEAEAALEDLETFVSGVLAPNPRYASLLSSPNLPILEKDRMLVDALEGKADPTAVRFLRVLNRHGRLGLLSAVVKQARATLDRRQNRKPVTVRSALALDEGQQAAIRDRLSAMIQATPVITLEVDPSLIGGLVVQIGDEVYDASVRTRLERLRGRLIERKTHEIQSRRDHFSYPA